ncbi:MAG: hypothetical protein WA063_06395 [Minisyncoccia bacterium]
MYQLKKISDIEDMPLGFTKENIFKDREAIKNKDLSIQFNGGISSSYLPINNSDIIGKGKKYTTLAVIEAANIQFTRDANIYINDSFIHLRWKSNNKNEIINNNPDYFACHGSITKIDCDTGFKIWRFEDKKDGTVKFYNDLVAGKTDLISQKWFNDFDKILSTFKFTEKNETADWQTYRTEKYGFEVKYPEYWNDIVVNKNRDFLNKGSAVTFSFENFPKRNNPRFVGYNEGINIRIYSKNYSCGPDEYNCAIYNCEEGFEGETEHKRPADSGISDYLIMFCKNVGNKEFLPAAIRYNYFIEENETSENIKNPITLQRINEFKAMVDLFRFTEK